MGDSDESVAVIKDNEETLHIWGYKVSKVKSAATWFLIFITVGIARLILYWYPKLLVRLTTSRCSLSVADHLLYFRDNHMNFDFIRIKCLNRSEDAYLSIPSGNLYMKDVDNLRCFSYKKVTYLWYHHLSQFLPVGAADSEILLSRFHELGETGLLEHEVLKRVSVYGKNLINVKLKPILVLLFKEVISPFYIFQIFSVSVWYSDEYELYASIIVLMSVLSISMDVYQTRKQEHDLRSMVHSTAVVEVVRNKGEIQSVDSEELVPGDVIIIPRHGCIMQCDAVLLNGTVIVNESMLTGESVPVTKVALPDAEGDENSSKFSFKEHSRHILFCGTEVMQTRYYSGLNVKAVVLRTAYATLKGQLVRSIMYPKPVDFRFTKDLFKFVGFLACVAACGFAYTIAVMISRGASWKLCLVRSLDIITIVVPPALPAAMSVGMIAAKIRLRKKDVFCIAPSTINTCGAINVVCFDKTGTLTEDGLDFYCVRGLKESKNDEPPEIDGELRGDPLDLILFKNTGWVLDETVEKGLDETARFDVIQPTVVRSVPGRFGFDEQIELGIIRQFTFSSSLQRMSVIVHNPKDPARSMTVYCKGSPEMIASLCQTESIPTNYSTIVNEYAQYGYRLIAVAYKKMDLSFVKTQKIKREAVECGLEMLGLVIMENRLKSQTIGVIQHLNRARIRPVMITGDNLLTAMSVARESGIIRPTKRAYIVETVVSETSGACGKTGLTLKQLVSSCDFVDDNCSGLDIESCNFIDSTYQLAITGDCLKHFLLLHLNVLSFVKEFIVNYFYCYLFLKVIGPTFAVVCDEYPELLEKLVTVCDVYARMSPDQKQFLVNKLQEVEYTVAMCGDGANDCAALKAAHAGISLSEAEASIAAPFTSKIPDIRCVLLVIREGRAALVTSFGVFKYMAGYSLTQFVTILQLYWIGSNLTDFQFLYIDLALVTLIALFFGNTASCVKISILPPPAHLLSVATVLSVIGQLTIVILFQLFVFIYTAYQPWFFPFTAPFDNMDEDKRSLQGTAIFSVSMFQYLTLAVVYSKGFPYRKTIFSNRPLFISLVLLFAISTWLCLFPPLNASSFMEIDPIPEFAYRAFLMAIGLISAACSFLYETYLIDYLILNVRENWRRKRHAKFESTDMSVFEKILLSVAGDPSWIITKKECIHNQLPEPVEFQAATILRSEGAVRLPGTLISNDAE
uniref:Cation-transporting ATPase n=1 Tax=Syphacia muris TaxID=451379 RepID=A0A0N5AX84_9BILA